MPLFNLIFLGLGWPWVGEFVGFVIFTCFPTQQNLVNRHDERFTGAITVTFALPSQAYYRYR